MTEKQIKTLSKPQLASIIEQQEREIARLNAELARPQLDSGSSALLGEIMKAAKEAADEYVRKAMLAENEKIDEIGRLEGEARRRNEEAERINTEASETMRTMLSDLNDVFNRQVDYIRSMQEEFHKMLCSTSLKDVFTAPGMPGENRQEQPTYAEPAQAESAPVESAPAEPAPPAFASPAPYESYEPPAYQAQNPYAETPFVNTDTTTEQTPQWPT